MRSSINTYCAEQAVFVIVILLLGAGILAFGAGWAVGYAIHGRQHATEVETSK